MRRRTTITYKTSAKAEPTSEAIWIQNLEETNVQNNVVLLRLNKDEDGKAILTPNQDGAMQYIVSIPVKGGAYAYVSTEAMKALLAFGAVREVQEDVWVSLLLDPLQPNLRDFNKGTTISKL